MSAQDFPEIPGYTIKRALGQGGMARVFMATQDSFGRDVALKVMSTHLSSDPVWGRRFLHEAQVVAQLSHPNVVPVFDVGHHNGCYYMSMELLRGGDLKSRLGKGVSIPDSVRIIRQIAAGLDFAGEKGFVHRDIKPENIMFREDGSPVILDFGIAKQKNSNNRMTQTGTIVGTTAYMSPEQAQGFELDERSDVYSLGILLYEMLTGRTPFIGESSVAVLLKHVSEPAPPLPDHLDIFQPVMDLALAKKPEDRYNRARDMARDLESLSEDVDILFANAAPVIVTVGSEDQTAVATAATQSGTRMTSSKRTSAKATIHARKQAEQAKQRRKNWIGIAVATLALGAPLSYLAYRQFVIAPQQEAQLKAEAESAKTAAQQKIANLLNEARQNYVADTEGDPKIAKKVIQDLQQVLLLDEKNTEAAKMSAELVEKHLARTRDLLAASQPLDAAEHLALVEMLRPQHGDLPALNSQLSELRSSSLTRQAEAMFMEKKMAELLAEARQYEEKGRLFSPAGNNAWDSYLAAQEFDATNAEVQQGMSRLLDKLYTRTEQDVRAGQLTTAKQSLLILQQHYTDKSRVMSLQQAIVTAEQQATESSMMEKQAAEASVEARRKAQVNSAAGKAAFEQALAARNYRLAEQHLAQISTAMPDDPELPALREKIARVSRSSEQNNDLLDNAGKLIASSGGSPEQARRKLNEAWDVIQNAKRMDPDGEWQSSKSALQSRYAELANSYLVANNKEAVELLLADARNNGLMNSQLDGVQAQLDDPEAPAAPKKKKPMAVGGF